MLQCSPKCPTVRRQLREQVEKAGWTDEYIRRVVGVQRVDIAQDFDRGSGRKIKKPLDPRKRTGKRLAIEYDDRHERDRRDRLEPTTAQDLVRVTDYEESTDFDETDDESEKPVLASLKQESIYYAEEKEIARGGKPLKRVTPKVSSQDTRVTPKVSSQDTRVTPKVSSQDTRVTPKVSSQDTRIARIPRSKTSRTRTPKNEAIIAYERDKRKMMLDYEKPGPSRTVDDKRTAKSRDGSPDSYYKYTPKELSSDWPHDGCDETCPASMLKERAEKVLPEKQRQTDSYSIIGRNYFDDVCTCSLLCMVHDLKKDPFVRSILTSAILFAVGMKLCSELHGWYLPTRA